MHHDHDRNGHDDDLYQRRPDVREDDSILLRLHDEHDERRLLLLHDDERHAGLLLNVTGCTLRCTSGALPSRKKEPHQMRRGAEPAGSQPSQRQSLKCKIARFGRAILHLSNCCKTFL